MSKNTLLYQGYFIPKPRMTRRDKIPRLQKKSVKEYFSFKEAIGWTAKGEGFELSSQCTMVFFIEMPKSWSKKKKAEKFLKPHDAKRRWDVDNLVKAVFDSLAEDDSFIWDCRAVKVWSDKPMIALFNNTGNTINIKNIYNTGKV